MFKELMRWITDSPAENLMICSPRNKKLLRKKFKYVPFKSLEDRNNILENYSRRKWIKPVENPFQYRYVRNFPEGRYLIRGNFKNWRKLYEKIGDSWYLQDDISGDVDGNLIYVDSKFHNFDSRYPPEFYKKLEEVSWCLSDKWKLNLRSFQRWDMDRRLKRIGI